MSVTGQTAAVSAPAQQRVVRGGIRPFLEKNGGLLFGGLLVVIFIICSVVIVARRGPSEFGNQLVLGLQRGAIYALIAVGYTMVYGIIELINFAHADVFTLSAFYSLVIGEALDKVGFHVGSIAPGSLGGLLLVLLIVLPLTMFLGGMTGVVIERVAYRPLRDAPKLAPLITAIGVSFLLQGIMFAVFGSGDVNAKKDKWIRGAAFSIGDVRVGWNDVFVIVTAILLMLVLQAFIRYSRTGKAMRATAQDRDAALLSGININRIISTTFFIGSAIAGGGALIYAIYYNDLQFNLGFKIGIIAFTAAVLGGIGNIVGAGLGGFLIGLVFVFGTELIGPQWAESLVFVMLILVLTLRPTGLLGLRVPDRA
ncbi:MAG: branched-chain amino acid ABC transporter permease [Candidatus Dormibacteria bacterium]